MAGDFFGKTARRAEWNEAKTFTYNCEEHIPLPYAGRNKNDI